jgi:hypothetical protein
LVLFADYETFVVKEKDGLKERARATGGANVLRTRHHVSWDAKNRHGLPAKIRWEEKKFPMELMPIFYPDAHAQSVGRGQRPVQKPAQQPVQQPVQQQTQPAQTQQEPTIQQQFNQEMNQLKQGQPVQTQPVQNTKAAAPVKQTAQSVQTDDTAFNHQLYQLMDKDGITEQELEAVVTARGIFPEGTSCHVYPEDFVSGWCVPNWQKIVDFVHSNIRQKGAA